MNTQRHVGGLAYTKGYIWVATDGRLGRYSTSKLKGKSGSILKADKPWSAVKSKASYAYGDGKNIWVGTANQKYQDFMYRYSVSGGKLTRHEGVRTPSKVQGVVVTPSKIIWSTSWGNPDSKLVVWPRSKSYPGTGRTGNWITAPPRAEGMTLVGNRLYLIFESASSVYSGNSGGQVNKTIHNGSIPPV